MRHEHGHEHGVMGSAHKQERLENPERVQELNPAATLERLELRDGETVCDIGAGSGLFALAAARLTKGKVYALETDEAMLSVIREKAGQAGLQNIEVVMVDAAASQFALPEASIDLALMVNVLHEIDDKPAFLSEARRIIKPDGRIAVIEFHARPTPLGPPAEYRLAPEAVTELLEEAGMERVEQFDMGENMYCMVFRMQSS